MKTAFIIFDQMTALDLIGVYDPLTRLKSMNFVPEFNWQICAFTEEVSDDKGLRFAPDTVAVSLSEYDMTALGVTSSIDLGLHLVERLAGSEARVGIAKQMDYP